MSVVEKTIRKLQEQRQLSAGEAHAPAGNQTPDASRSSESPPSHNAAPSTASPPAIILDRGALQAAGLMPPEEEGSLLTRQYRKIKHPLVAKAMGRGVPREPKGYLIMIASATAGEGKSFTALNLALSLALEKDVHVLLVDADAPKPHLSKVMGVGDQPGLLDALRDSALDVESLIRGTNVPSLSFLPVGIGAADDATELLSSARMERIAAQLGQRDSRRIVVFDSPPLLQTTESPALARIAGQIIVVVRAQATPQPVLLDALSSLQGHPGVSLVLNQSTQSGTSPYYYYGYGDKEGGVGSAKAAGA